MGVVTRQVRAEQTLVYTIILLLSFNPLFSFVNTLTNIFLGEGFIYDTLLLYIFLLLMLFKSLFIISQRIKKDILISFLILIFIFLVTSILFPSNITWMFTSWNDFLNNPFYFFVFALLAYVFSRYITDMSFFVFKLGQISIIVVLVTLLNYFVLVNQGVIIEYMVISYDVLLFTTFLLIISFEKNNIKYRLIGLVGAIFIFVVGARGAFISLLLTLTTYFFFSQISRVKKTLILFLVTLTIILLWQYFETILLFLSDKIVGVGMDSRTINTLIGQSFFDDSGRGDIQKELIDRFNLWGYGIFGDRYNGGYAHNLFVEIIYQWGYVLGPLICFILLLLISIGLINKKNSFNICVLAFLSSGFFKLLFSGSYITEVNFAVLIALCINSIKNLQNHFSNQTRINNEGTLAS